MSTPSVTPENSSNSELVDLNGTSGPSVSQALSREMLVNHLTSGVRQFPNCDLTGADLTGIAVSGAIFSGSLFNRADLSKATFASCDMTECQFKDANLTEVEIVGGS